MGEIADSVLLNLSINGNEICHITDALLAYERTVTISNHIEQKGYCSRKKCFPTTFGLDGSIPRVPFNSIDRQPLSIIMMRYQYLFLSARKSDTSQVVGFFFISLIFTNNAMLKSNAAFSLLFSRETLTTIIHVFVNDTWFRF